MPKTHWFLLPGLDGTGILFDAFKSAAPNDVSLHVISYPTDTPQSYDDLVSIVLSVLPANDPYVLIAESFSGPVAILVAGKASHPPLALILCATFASCPVGAFTRKIASAASGILFRLKPPKWFATAYMLGVEAPPQLINNFYRALQSVSTSTLQARLEALLNVNVLSNLANLPIPTLYVQATQDRLLGKRSLTQIQGQCPNVQIANLNAPHLVLQRQPEQVVALITQFVRREHNRGS